MFTALKILSIFCLSLSLFGCGSESIFPSNPPARVPQSTTPPIAPPTTPPTTPTTTPQPAPQPTSRPTTTPAPAPAPSSPTAQRSGGACPVQPRLSGSVVNGAPFTDCGFPDASRIPNPTKMKHGLQEMSGLTTCITPDFKPAKWAFPNLPTVEITNSNQIYHNSATFPGEVVFSGQNVVFTNTQNGRVRGRVSCGRGARNIEYEGECICP